MDKQGTVDLDQETIIDEGSQNEDNSETGERENTKLDLLEQTGSSENGKDEYNGESLVVLSYSDGDILCDLEGHGGLEAGHDLNGQGQFEHGTGQDNELENDLVVDNQGSESTDNGQVERSGGPDNELDNNLVVDNKDSGSKENGQVECSSGPDNKPDNNLVFDNKDSGSKDNGQVEHSGGPDNELDNNLVVDNKSSGSTENGQVECSGGPDNEPDNDLFVDNKDSGSTEKGPVEGTGRGYDYKGLDKNLIVDDVDIDTAFTEEREGKMRDYFDMSEKGKYEDWSFVWNERHKENLLSAETQNMDYFENLSLSGFMDGKMDERVGICTEEKGYYGNIEQKNEWVGEEVVKRGRKRKLVQIDMPNKRR